MPEHLVFTLTAALGSMGDFAGHERRGSLTWPGKSAILGLLGAAMGIRRGGDFSRLDRLRMAVAVFDAGEVLRDFHTAQSVPSAALKQVQSRPQALREARDGVQTVLTQRDYRTSPLFGVALWDGDDLAEIAQALRHPVFTLYLGRKSCPLSAPTAPALIEAEEPIAAMASLTLPPWSNAPQTCRVIADDGTFKTSHTETRNDMPVDRDHWHFGPREVEMMTATITPRIAREERP